MKFKFIKWMLAACLSVFACAAQALISCSVSSPGFTAAYIPTNAGMNITQTSFTVTCVRGLLVDPTTQTYSVKADNGLNPTAGLNRGVFNATNFIKYDLYTSSACLTQWKGGTSLPVGGGTMTLVGTTPTSVTTSYWGCIPAAQAGLASGNYTDTVSMTLTATAALITNNTFPVSIFSPATCNISAAAGNLNFGNYSALGATVLANASFGATCTSTLPYTMSLDVNNGVISGLQYTLLLNSINSGGSNTLSRTGSGAQQTFFINGSMAAGQAGTCAIGSCTGSKPHTLTITY